MNLINDVDRPGSDIENYAATLDKELADKVEKINLVRGRLQKFRMLLKDEESLSTKFMGNNDMLDLYEINKQNNLNNFDDDDLLAEDFTHHLPSNIRK